MAIRQTQVQIQVYEHSPTLNTVLMVENVLKNMPNSVMTVAELKRNLPKQINHNLLKTILDYLDKSNKIYFSVDGITWIYSESPKLREAIKKGWEWKPSNLKKA